MTALTHNLVIKIGTAALGASNGMPDAQLLGGLVAELAALKKEGYQLILVSSGAVGTGRALAKAGTALKDCDTVAEKQILASLGQAKLMTLYQELLTPHRLLASQILLTKQDFRSREHHKHMAHLFTALQKQPHILPIVNENDSVTIDELMFTDNDELAGLLAAMVNAERLIILSHVPGVYDRGPDEAGAQIVPQIDWMNDILPKSMKGKSESGRGGMASKLNVARKMSGFGIRTHIASAREEKIITRLMQDEAIGTHVHALPDTRRDAIDWLTNGIDMWDCVEA